MPAFRTLREFTRQTFRACLGRLPCRAGGYAGAGFALVLLAGTAWRPGATTSAVDEAPPAAVELLAVAEPATSPMDEPVRLIKKAKESFANVKDYTCVLIKKEKLDDNPPAENVIAMKVRNNPFSVYLKWQEPKNLTGQEAVYVAGKNAGKMRVKPSGLLGSVGFVSLDPEDARAKQTSKHAITEAGIGNLIERTVKGWEAEQKLNQTQVKVGEFEYNKRRCTRVETVHPTNPGGVFLFHRFIIYFDKETNLPIRVECYDWPKKEGDKGELAECYSYANLKLNVGLGDDVFDK